MVPLRDEAGISLGTDQLPKLFTATLVGSLIASPLSSSFLSSGKEATIRQLYSLIGLILVAFYVLYLVSSFEPTGSFHQSVKMAFYVFLNVENLVVISALWARAADTFNADSSRRLFGFISAAATSGQLAGSLITVLVSKGSRKSSGSQPLYGLVFLSAIFMFLAAFFSVRIQRFSSKERPAFESMDPKPRSVSVSQLFTSILLITRSNYLLLLCLYLTMTYVVGSLMYFQRSLVVAASITDSNERTAFFAQVYSLSAVAIIVLQLLATGRLLSLLGISFALSCFPISCAALIGGVAHFPSTSSLAAAEVTRKILGYVLVRPAREVLFTVVSREEKYHCKLLIDSVLQRLGDSLAAAMFELLDVRLKLGQEGVAVAGFMMCIVWLIGSASLGSSFRWLSDPAASIQFLTAAAAQEDISLSIPLTQQSNLASVATAERVTAPTTYTLAVGTSSPSRRDRETKIERV